MSGKSPGGGSRTAILRARLTRLTLGTHDWIGQYRANGKTKEQGPDRHTPDQRPPVTRSNSVLLQP